MRSPLAGILAFVLAAGLFVALSYAPPDGVADTESVPPPPANEFPAPPAQPVRQAGGRAEPRGPVTFATLDGDQEIVVRVESTGCFNHSRHKLVFRKAERLHVDVARVDDAGVETALGGKDLEGDDAGRLDKLLAFYREGHQGGCTSVDEVEVTCVVDGRPVASESFSDDTCSTFERKDLMPFGAIIVDVQAQYESAHDNAAE